MDNKQYQVHEDKLSTIFVRELLCLLEYVCLLKLKKQ